ncbi:alpha/beta fold hydrolase [Roseomonas sp. 18066]|uniref:alpha/beta fold hydrolase n=1 Tax=Roseomonas sp. 18066 TaxID=2681412 RepID=UPI001357573B|nr:alpha/beta hydrolase [Roseomonas sp. 18066]
MPDPLPFGLPAGPAPRQKGFLQRPDCRIYYEVTGQGPALVFAHGLGGNHLSWFHQVAAFADRYACISFSHRGFFPSDAPAGGPDPADFAGDLAALLAHLGVEEFAIVGQSMGGWTALGHALAGGAGLRALVLAATSGPVDPAQGDAAGAFSSWQASASRAQVAGRAKGVHPALGARGAGEQPAAHFLYRALDELSATLDKEALRGRMMRGRDQPASLLAGIAVPTLWLTGAEDIVFPSPVAPLLAAAMPRARHVDFAETGHSAYFERPAAFNAALAAFLAEHFPGGEVLP